MNSHIYLAILFALLSCCLSCANAQFRMINGVPIDIKNSPHTVSIFICSEYNCVGSLVTLKSVVTAANGVFGKEASDLKVLAGEADIDKIGTGSGQERDVQDIICDNGYTKGSLYMDIAVVKLEEPFGKSMGVKPIEVCDFVLQTGNLMEVRGWKGFLCGNVPPNLLQTAQVYIKLKDECQLKFGSLIILSETTICAACGGQNICLGIPGAGAIMRNKLCAVASGTTNIPELPSLFTDLTHPKVIEFLQCNIDFNE